ncbi:hypothetical protein AVEN_97333-1 [Araneus ventricosus]|uniref:Uncharacterized protein n=1 Tax=Araneus ventricosus TaxID=182803 RepID=A0A4Y2MZQ1_ARAVE|nr:hypothetical protein AVEN_97333-1 [Araneus ventricosus]
MVVSTSASGSTLVQYKHLSCGCVLAALFKSLLRQWWFSADYLKAGQGSGGLVVRSRLRDRRGPGSKPESAEDPPGVWVWFATNLTLRVKCPPAGIVWTFGEEYLLRSSPRLLTTVQN